MKCLILLTHFLTKEHVAHSTGKFEKLVDVVVRCGNQRLKQFLKTVPRNAVYTSRVAVVELIKSLGGGVDSEESSKSILMADEYTDVSTVEELTVFCHWEEDGVSVECFLEIITLKKADAETIYSNLIECLKRKNLQVGRIVGMELPLFLDERPAAFRHASKIILLMLGLYTAAVTCCSWLVCKLPTIFQE